MSAQDDYVSDMLTRYNAAGLRLNAALNTERTGDFVEAHRVSAVTPEAVQDWAVGTLEEWLPGYTQPDDETGEQYRIKQITDDTYRVETLDGHAERRFRITVSVFEVPT